MGLGQCLKYGDKTKAKTKDKKKKKVNLEKVFGC